MHTILRNTISKFIILIGKRVVLKEDIFHKKHQIGKLRNNFIEAL